MFHYIRRAFIKLLDTEVDWMDQKTKSYAKKKAEALQVKVGYNPHLYKNMTYLNERVKNVSHTHLN